MHTKTFEATGEIKEKNQIKKFTKVVTALNRNVAEHKVKAMFGSKNRIKAKNVMIKDVKEIKQ